MENGKLFRTTLNNEFMYLFRLRSLTETRRVIFGHSGMAVLTCSVPNQLKGGGREGYNFWYHDLEHFDLHNEFQ